MQVLCDRVHSVCILHRKEGLRELGEGRGRGVSLFDLSFTWDSASRKNRVLGVSVGRIQT